MRFFVMENMNPTLPYAGQQVKPPDAGRPRDGALKPNRLLSAGSSLGTDLVTAVNARIPFEVLRQRLGGDITDVIPPG